MFGKKKENEKVGVAPKLPEPKVCCGCGCLVDPIRAEKVVIDFTYDAYYCGRCAPPYDKTYNFVEGTRYYITLPEHEQEVTKDGEPVKPKGKKPS